MWNKKAQTISAECQKIKIRQFNFELSELNWPLINGLICKGNGLSQCSPIVCFGDFSVSVSFVQQLDLNPLLPDWKSTFSPGIFRFFYAIVEFSRPEQWLLCQIHILFYRKKHKNNTLKNKTSIKHLIKIINLGRRVKSSTLRIIILEAQYLCLVRLPSVLHLDVSMSYR